MFIVEVGSKIFVQVPIIKGNGNRNSGSLLVHKNIIKYAKKYVSTAATTGMISCALDNRPCLDPVAVNPLTFQSDPKVISTHLNSSSFS